MNTKGTNLKGMSERRFGSIIFLFKITGIPVQMKKISTIYAVYMITVIICGISTYIGMFADVYINWNDLVHAMTTMRILIPVTNVMWIYSYCM
jgi:hypothetical protein